MKKAKTFACALASLLVLAGCSSTQNEAKTDQNDANVSKQSQESAQELLKSGKIASGLSRLIEDTSAAYSTGVSEVQTVAGLEVQSADGTLQALNAEADETTTDGFAVKDAYYIARASGDTRTYTMYGSGSAQSVTFDLTGDGSEGVLTAINPTDRMASTPAERQQELIADNFRVDMLGIDPTLEQYDQSFKASIDTDEDGSWMATIKAADFKAAGETVNDEAVQAATVQDLEYTIWVNDKNQLERIQPTVKMELTGTDGTNVSADYTKDTTIAAWKKDDALQKAMEKVFAQVQDGAQVGTALSLDAAAAREE